MIFLLSQKLMNIAQDLIQICHLKKILDMDK